MERRAKLAGLDTATTRLVGAEGGPVEISLEHLEARIAELAHAESE